MISKAKKYIYIQSPYFIPDESVMDALKMAILSGIDVRIMVPNKPDHIFVYWATYSFIGELAELGAKTYIYENGFIHTKMLLSTMNYQVQVAQTSIIEVSNLTLN